jgi:putative ATP-binding cassette transporter
MAGIYQLLRFFIEFSREIRFARWTIVLIVFVGTLSGVTTTALIGMVNGVLTGEGVGGLTFGRLYAALALVMVASAVASDLLLIHLGQQALFNLRMRLCAKVLTSPLAHLEKLGPARLLATLTNDIGMITESFSMLPNLIQSGATVAASLAYLIWLSPTGGAALIAFLSLGILTFQIPLVRGVRMQAVAREKFDDLYQHLRGITEGAKEFKMNGQRRDRFMDAQLKPTITDLKHWNVRSSSVFALATNWGFSLFFLALGFLVVGFPLLGIGGGGILVSFSTVLLLLVGPLESILFTLPRLGQATVSAQKIKDLGLALEVPVVEAHWSEAPLAVDWRRLELAGVVYSYGVPDGGKSFTVGPVALSFEPGEIVFIIGGNGSGKTSLAKVLAGLYPVDGGEIRIDGEVIDDGNRDAYRQLFAAVFGDFFLFRELVAADPEGLTERAEEYLRRLQLEDKVEIQDGAFSTLDLSQGQRKRLALLAAYLEDRPIYLFDEWAADQDPMFKKIFYETLLPQLKAAGKSIFVISHDDQYYHLADRIIKFDYGVVEYDKRGEALTPASINV